MAAPIGEVDALRAVSDHVVFKRGRRLGVIPTRDHYVASNQPTLRLRGVPAIMPLTHAGVNTQRVGAVGLILGTIAGLVPTAAVPMLIGSMGFQLGYGVRQGLRMAYNFGQQQRSLNQEAQQLGPAPATTPIAKAVGRLNKENGLRAKTSFLPAGGLSSVVNIMASTSTLLRPPLLGHFSAGAAAASVTLAHVAVPLISLFSLTSGAYGVYYIVFGYQRQKHMGDVMNSAVTGHEHLAYHRMIKRVRAERHNAVASTAANFAMAVGGPLIFAIGPYALTLLVPAAVVSAVTSYTWARQVAYLPQFTQAERLNFQNEHLLVNEIPRAKTNHDDLKTIKHTLRPLFPYARDSPMRYIVRPWNALHRRLRPQWTANLPPAEDSVRLYWNQHLQTEGDYVQGWVRIAQHKLDRHQRHGNQEGVRRAQHNLREARASMAWVSHAQASIPGQQPGSAVARFNWLVDMMVTEKTFPTFARKLMRDKKLRTLWRERGFPKQGKEWVVDATQLKVAFAAETPALQDTILRHAFAHGRAALLTFTKLSYQYREREVLDILSLYLRAKAKLRP